MSSETPFTDAIPTHLTIARFPSPIGALLIATDEHHLLRALVFGDELEALTARLRRDYAAVVIEPGPLPDSTHAALSAYFAGNHAALAGIPTATAGTPFQRAVWAALSQIPIGQTVSYLEIATRIGKPKAVRAVGMANGANPIGLVVPCHRVIGANGTLTGFGGGIERKRWLLAHEGVAIPRTLSLVPANGIS